MYLDGFCGPGRYLGGEDGSPIIALKEALKHSILLQNSEIIFFFIDQDQERIAHLEFEISQLTLPPNFLVRIRIGEFQSILQQELDQADKAGYNLAPAFAFIDPFGFKGIPFNLVKRLLTNPHTEVFINVMIDFVNRFIEHPDPQTQQHIVDLFGTTQALNIIQASNNRLPDLRRLYLSQLQQHARFVRYFEMRNERDRIIYYLFFATKHPLGHARMKEAFWKVDPTNGFTFSDKTNPNQLVLFELDPSLELAEILISRFRGKRVTVKVICEFVENGQFVKSCVKVRWQVPC
jgi:three-Cys-motif partner protein